MNSYFRSIFQSQRSVLTLFTVLFPILAASGAAAGTQIGDWGHCITYAPTVYLYNPDGEAFTLQFRRMQPAFNAWVRDEMEFRLADPDGKEIFEGKKKLDGGLLTFEVPAGKKGTYRLNTTRSLSVWCSLDHSAVWTGEPGRHIADDYDPIEDPETGKKRRRKYYEKRGQLVFQATVPRRWWFWVPEDVTEFKCRAMRADRHMSQREDWGYFIISPRGQRIKAMWGQPPFRTEKRYRGDMIVTVPVEPGAGGRFWSVQIRLGDSHNFSGINFSLDGVPPYLARSPEEWFDPAKGVPEVDLYDETPFIQATYRDEPVRELMKERWPKLQHWSPCPSLGDPDGIEILGNAGFALWNPEGRELKLRVGAYLPRHGRKGKDPAGVTVTGPDGKTVLDKTVELISIHAPHGYPDQVLDAGKGVSTVSVTGDPEKWFAFTYPATPLVLIGESVEDGWSRFSMTVGTARQWYFYVPKGTEEFAVHTEAKHDTDVARVEVWAPDRCVSLIYDNEATESVEVPEGLDGKIWYLRTDVGSASRFVTDRGPEYRYAGIYLNIDLKGVPGYLSPTWEQWFDPENPASTAAGARVMNGLTRH
ncbi:MAG: hypothetical protein R6V03_03310 [Kiritimatiellia bacterium]